MSEPVLFLHPNRIDNATVGGGSWDTNQPLSRVKDRILNKRARSDSLSTSDAQMDITLSTSGQIKGVALIDHNIRPSAKWRVEAYSDSSFTTQEYDSGFIYCWQSTDDAERGWADDNFETARPKPDDVNDINWPILHTILSGVDQLYWRITIDDPSNVDGYVEVGRVFIGYGWQAPIGFAEGLQEGWRDDSDVQQSFSGVEFFRNRQPYRELRGSLQLLEKDQAFGRAQDLLRRAKTTKEVLVVPQPNETNNVNRRAFLARMTELSRLERQLPDFGNQSFALKELR